MSDLESYKTYVFDGDTAIETLPPHCNVTVNNGNLTVAIIGKNSEVTVPDGYIVFNQAGHEAKVTAQAIKGKNIAGAGEFTALESDIILEGNSGKDTKLTASKGNITLGNIGTNNIVNALEGKVNFGKSGDFAKVTAKAISGDDVGQKGQYIALEGNIDISGTSGMFTRFQANNGDISLNALELDCEATAPNGKVSFGAADTSVKIRAQSIAGSSIENFGFYQASEGDITITGDCGDNVQLKAQTGNISVNNFGHRCTFNAPNGAITFNCSGSEVTVNAREIAGKNILKAYGTYTADKIHISGKVAACTKLNAPVVETPNPEGVGIDASELPPTYRQLGRRMIEHDDGTIEFPKAYILGSPKTLDHLRGQGIKVNEFEKDGQSWIRIKDHPGNPNMGPLRDLVLGLENKLSGPGHGY